MADYDTLTLIKAVIRETPLLTAKEITVELHKRGHPRAYTHVITSLMDLRRRGEAEPHVMEPPGKRRAGSLPYRWTLTEEAR